MGNGSQSTAGAKTGASWPSLRQALASVLATWNVQRLAVKLIAGIGLVGFLAIGTSSLLLATTIRPGFESLEKRVIDDQVERAKLALTTDIADLESHAQDYAIWDESYQFALDGNEAFKNETLDPPSISNLSINGFAYVRYSGEVLGAVYLDETSDKADESLSGHLATIASSPTILATARKGKPFHRFVTMDGKFILVSGAPITKSDGSGVSTAFVFMAREISVPDISSLLRTEVKLIPLSAMHGQKLETRIDDGWLITVPIANDGQSPLGGLQFRLPASISTLGSRTLSIALTTTIAILLTLLIATIWIVRSLVLDPVARVSERLYQIGRSGRLEELDQKPRSFEIGLLGQVFNEMVGQLRAARKELEDRSYELGKSDWAAGVVHNVRNSLAPVTVILTKSVTDGASVDSALVARAIAELARPEISSDRRAKLAQFLGRVLQDFDDRGTVRRKELTSAKLLVGEALEILANRSEDRAAEKVPVEPVNIHEVVLGNAPLAQFAKFGRVDFTMPESGPDILANRLQISQVVANLITNSLESISRTDNRPGRIAVSFHEAVVEGSQALEIRIRDNGTGFSSETGARLFERGYSSKAAKRGGLGLHWCANTVTAMGGNLELVSPGEGQGACARLTLPLADPQSSVNSIAA